MIPVIKWTLRQRRWSTVWWSVGVCGLLFINMIFYPTFKNQAAELQKSFDSLPEAAVQLFGGSTDFFSPVGFLNSQVFFLMLPMLLTILAVTLGSSLIAREEDEKTIELLLARPLSRTRLLLAKALSGTVILAVVTLVGLISTIGLAWGVNLAVPAANMAFTMLSCFLLSLSCGAIAFLLTTTGRARGASIGIVALIALGGYLVASLSGTVSWLKDPSHFFPFEYYQSEAALRGAHDWGNILVLVSIVLACGLLSWLSFRRRDIG